MTADRVEHAAADLAGTAAMAVLVYRLCSGEPATEALGAALAVLLLAVPGALRLATGLPHLVGTGRAARLGVLISGEDALARRVDRVVLAGPLTGGGLEVHAVHAVGGCAPAEVLRMAGAVARASDRPVDRAVAAAAPQLLPGVADFDTVDGLGVRGIVAEVVGAPGEDPRVIAHAVLVGSADLLGAHDIGLPTATTTAGCTPVAVAWDGVARGVLDVGPAVAPATVAAVRELSGLGVRPVLLAAEAAPVAHAVAARAGLAPDAVLTGITPADAAPLIEELGRHVAVITDSDRHEAAVAGGDLAVRNDSNPPNASRDHRPALTMVRGDLPAAVDAIRLARHSAAVTRANLAGSLAFMAALLPATATGLLDPSLSATATVVGAAVLVLNSVRPQRPGATRG